MTREEAIEVVKERLDYYEREKRFRAACEILIPELAESEDEKIRKELIFFLKEEIPQCSIKEHADKLKEFVSYLEKQKEEKPEWKKATINGEPIPTENQSVNISLAEWSGEDNICWDEAFACVTRAKKTAKNEEELQSAVTAEKWLKEIQFKYYVHPVKQEWSEEDERIINGIQFVLESWDRSHVSSAGLPSLIPKYISWLKSFRPNKQD